MVESAQLKMGPKSVHPQSVRNGSKKHARMTRYFHTFYGNFSKISTETRVRTRTSAKNSQKSVKISKKITQKKGISPSGLILLGEIREKMAKFGLNLAILAQRRVPFATKPIKPGEQFLSAGRRVRVRCQQCQPRCRTRCTWA